MINSPKVVAYCSLTILVALYIVGAVSNGSLRHEVQTLPLWAPIVLGFRQRPAAKWAAVPCFIIWFALMTFNMVDDEEIAGGGGRHEFKPQLLLQGFKKIGSGSHSLIGL